jgi:hypothetical protein
MVLQEVELDPISVVSVECEEYSVKYCQSHKTLPWV